MLKRLRVTLKERGQLSKPVIDETFGIPSATLYQHRFGSLRKAYDLIGYKPKRDCRDIDSRRERVETVAGLVSQIISKVEKIGGATQFDDSTGTLIIDRTLNISFRIARCWRAPKESPIWTIQRRVYLPEGLIFAVRMNETNEDVIDCFLMPTSEMVGRRIRFSEKGQSKYKPYRFASVEAAVRWLVRRVTKCRIQGSGKPWSRRKRHSSRSPVTRQCAASGK
jgi:hypothetical protein